MYFNFYSESTNHELLSVVNLLPLWYKINLLLLVPILKKGLRQLESTSFRNLKSIKI